MENEHLLLDAASLIKHWLHAFSISSPNFTQHHFLLRLGRCWIQPGANSGLVSILPDFFDLTW
jgi:hypothetical protein